MFAVLSSLICGNFVCRVCRKTAPIFIAITLSILSQFSYFWHSKIKPASLCNRILVEIMWGLLGALHSYFLITSESSCNPSNFIKCQSNSDRFFFYIFTGTFSSQCAIKRSLKILKFSLYYLVFDKHF